MADNDSQDYPTPEETLHQFQAAHDERLASLGRRSEDDVERAAEAERDALYRHAEAIRSHAARLAKFGR